MHVNRNMMLHVNGLVKSWTGLVTRRGEEKFVHEFWGTDVKERDHLDDLSLDGSIISK